jgi:hypothetical protein
MQRCGRPGAKLGAPGSPLIPYWLTPDDVCGIITE